MAAIFHLHYLGHNIKYGNLEVGNITTIVFNKTTILQHWVYWIIFIFESFLSHIIQVIYLHIYIYKVSYIRSFFVIFNCHVFSALGSKQFEIYKEIFCKLMSRLLRSTIDQMMWYFWVFLVNPFSLFMEYFLKKTVFLLVSLSLAYRWVNQLRYFGTPTVRFFLKMSSPCWRIFSISLDELNSIDWFLKSWW